MQTREGKQIPKIAPQFGLQAATRLHEAGIASNRGSAYRGECVPEPCTHRPSSHESGGIRSRRGNRKELSAEDKLRDWD